jgi:hypothetical protein
MVTAGLALATASIVGFCWALYEVIHIGTCASGGPYVSARPCPPGTGGKIGLLIGSIWALVIAAGIYTARGGGGDRRVGAALPFWVVGFLSLSGTVLLAGLGAAAPDGAEGISIFLGALFGVMGLAGVPVLVASLRFKREAKSLVGGSGMSELLGALKKVQSRGGIQDLGGVRVAMKDPDEVAARLRKLDELREQGLLTDAEHDEQRRRILGEL